LGSYGCGGLVDRGRAYKQVWVADQQVAQAVLDMTGLGEDSGSRARALRARWEVRVPLIG